MNQVIESITITKEMPILQALKKMDAANRKLLIVTYNNKSFFGLVSIGDVQRAIINNVPLSEPVSVILRKDITVARENDDLQMVKRLMKAKRIEFMPIVNDDKQVVKVIFWEDLFKDASDAGPAFRFDLPVVIMAGGEGSRLRPFTNVLPKPLFPRGEKTIIEHIFDRFNAHGCNRFYVSVNYKSELIEFYLKQQNLPYSVNFFREKKPLGTAGSLSMLKGKINDTFFVSNCDILIDQDFSEVLQYHNQNNNEITILAALKHYPIPYGVLETSENGHLVKLDEKPELTLKINSGMYVLEPHLLSEIPKNRFFHITELIDSVNMRNGGIGVFPVSEKSWIDIGDSLAQPLNI